MTELFARVWYRFRNWVFMKRYIYYSVTSEHHLWAKHWSVCFICSRCAYQRLEMNSYYFCGQDVCLESTNYTRRILLVLYSGYASHVFGCNYVVLFRKMRKKLSVENEVPLIGTPTIGIESLLLQCGRNRYRSYKFAGDNARCQFLK